MIKKILIILFFISFLMSGNIHQVLAQDKVDVIFFLRLGCTHCENEEKFLTDLEKKRDDIVVTKFHLENPKEREVWDIFTSRLKTSKVTPITVIGKNYIIGFDKPETTGKEIISLIEQTKELQLKTDLNSVELEASQVEDGTCDENGLVPCKAQGAYSVTLPIVGKLDTQKYPLLVLSAILGLFDGFNPCAMWVLVTFLIILIQVGDKKKMILFAGTFIVAEAIMYTLILTVWFKTWDFVKLDTIITPIVGFVAIIGGLFFLKEWRKKELECKVTNLQQRSKTKQKIQSLASEKFTILTFLAILGIAFSVNIIEFACSIGIPQAFTKILELNHLPLMQNGFLIAVYIFFYMLDDFFVFALAFWGAEKLDLTHKYSKISNLIGGIVMIILGLILLLKPSFLLF